MVAACLASIIGGCGRSAPGTRMPSAEHVNASDQPLAREGGSTAVWTMNTHA
jgi:hypothetical protein